MMLGVVIWSCRRTGQAIIWCSDGRDLARFDGGRTGRAGAECQAIEPGDLVEIALACNSATRICTSLRLIEPAYMPEVVQQLTTAGRRAAIAAA